MTVPCPYLVLRLETAEQVIKVGWLFDLRLSCLGPYVNKSETRIVYTYAKPQVVAEHPYMDF